MVLLRLPLAQPNRFFTITPPEDDDSIFNFGYTLSLHEGLLAIGAPVPGGGKVFLYKLNAEGSAEFLTTLEPAEDDQTPGRLFGREVQVWNGAVEVTSEDGKRSPRLYTFENCESTTEYTSSFTVLFQDVALDHIDFDGDQFVAVSRAGDVRICARDSAGGFSGSTCDEMTLHSQTGLPLGNNEQVFATEALSLSLSGNTLAVGAQVNDPTGAVRIYKKREGTWAHVYTMASPKLGFGTGKLNYGSSIALHRDVLYSQSSLQGFRPFGGSFVATRQCDSFERLTTPLTIEVFIDGTRQRWNSTEDGTCRVTDSTGTLELEPTYLADGRVQFRPEARGSYLESCSSGSLTSRIQDFSFFGDPEASNRQISL